MKLYELSVEDYAEKLQSSEPAPGGGTAAAFSGLQGAALLTMVAELTLDREKFAEFAPLCQETVQQGDILCRRFVELTEEDAQAYFAVAAAFKLPKATEDEKKARSAAIQKATLHATKIPFETMKLGLKGLRMAATLAGKSNPNAASDLGVAALCLNACVQGAWLNVRINLSGLKDESLEKTFFSEGMSMKEEALALSEKISTSMDACMG